MKLKELISYLETAQQKLGPDTEVLVSSTWGDDEDADEIEDVIMKVQQSLVNVNLNSDDSKVIIKF